MTEIHLRQPGFTYSACDAFTKNKDRIQKFKETGDSWYIYWNELDQACFQRDMADGEFEDLTRRRVSDKILHDTAFNIANNLKYDGYYRGLASIVYKFFDKKSASLARSETLATRDKCTSGSGIKNENMSDKELAKKLHKLSIRKFKKEKVYSPFVDNIWGTDLVGMHLISKFNKGIRFLLCAIDIFSKYARVIPLKDKKSISIPNAFQKILDESNRKPNMIWVDKGSELDQWNHG